MLRWTVDLPLLGSMAEVELQLTGDAVRLSSARYAVLEVVLPRAVDADGAKAKFLRKSQQLRLELPLVAN
eukprot:SAG11_NODE_5256_length_1614_cov_1.347855_1_plen_70_part_00